MPSKKLRFEMTRDQALAHAKDPAPPCPRCTALYDAGKIRGETVMPLPEGARAPLAIDGSGPCCYDCGSADTVIKLRLVPLSQNFVDGKRDPDDYRQAFEMARIAVGNDRQDQFRLPGAPMGLVAQRIVRPSADGDLERHHAWLAGHRIDLGIKFIGCTWASFAKQYPNAGADWDVCSRKHQLENATIKLALAVDMQGEQRLEVWIIDEDDERIDRFAYVKRWYSTKRRKLIDQFYWRHEP